MSSERRSSGTAGQEERKPPDGAPDSDGARSGRGQSGGRRRRLYRGGPRLSREQQGRETLLGDDGNIVQRAGQHGRAARLVRRRVLPHCSLISNFSLKIADCFAVFTSFFPKFAIFAKILLNCRQFNQIFSGFFQNATFF